MNSEIYSIQYPIDTIYVLINDFFYVSKLSLDINLIEMKIVVKLSVFEFYIFSINIYIYTYIQLFQKISIYRIECNVTFISFLFQ